MLNVQTFCIFLKNKHLIILKRKKVAILKSKKQALLCRKNTDGLIHELNTAKGKNSELEFRAEKMSWNPAWRDKNIEVIFKKYLKHMEN